MAMTDSSPRWDPEIRPLAATVVQENGTWTMFIPGLPIAAEGTTLAEATADLIEALREYAQDWKDHLQAAPNHANNSELVRIIEGSTDEQLAQWLIESCS